MQSECESIGDDTIGMSRAELVLYKEILTGILEHTTDFKMKVEAEHLLGMVKKALRND